MSHDLRLLAVDVATNFVFSGSGGIERENDPANTPAPRVFLAGCAGGNLARVRTDVGADAAQAVFDVVAQEPPWADPSCPPRCLADVKRALSREAPVEKAEPGPIYELPHELGYESGATIILGDSAEGRRLLSRLSKRQMPQHLVEAGFASVDDFWEPWCVGLEGADIASIAFAARIGPLGAEIGVHTFPPFRGRGYAAAVTAAWASEPGLEGRALFYSTTITNRSSQRVADRLGLRRLGAGIRIY